MRRRRLYLLLLAMGAVAVALIVAFASPREPAFGGRSLSQWARQLRAAKSGHGDKEAEEAVRQIGTNALPYLLKWIRYEPPAWKRRLALPINRVIWRVHPAWEIGDQKGWQRASGAGLALVALGRAADGAIPELTRLLNDRNATNAAFLAADALAGLGDPGLPPLLAALTNQQSSGMLKAMIITAIYFGPNIEVRPKRLHNSLIIRTLLDLFGDPDWKVRNVATNVLRLMDPDALKNGQPSVYFLEN